MSTPNTVDTAQQQAIPSADASQYMISGITYIPQWNEVDVTRACFRRKYPILYRGPPGTGKTTLAYYFAQEERLPLVRMVCTEDTEERHFLGTYTKSGWVDGRAVFAARQAAGAVLYVDEIGKARPNAIVVLHSAADDTRELDISDRNEVLKLPQRCMIIASYNPTGREQLDAGTLHRFPTVDIGFPEQSIELAIIKAYLGDKYTPPTQKKESAKKSDQKIDEAKVLDHLVAIAGEYRRMAESREGGIREGPGPRMIARTAGLWREGIDLGTAIEVGLINPLTYDREAKAALLDVVQKKIRV